MSVREIHRWLEASIDRLAVARARETPGERPDSEDERTASVCRAFVALFQPQREGDLPPAAVRSAIVEQFHRLYYHDSASTWRNTTYRGVGTQKCPLDLWIYQELLSRIRPELIIETGTNLGGSAYFLADLCETLGVGEVLTIDIEDRPGRPVHDRITYLQGSSVDPAIVERVAARRPPRNPVLVILDSDHTCSHVLAELETYAPMVTEQSYLIVEDTNVSGHPALPIYPAGPMEAVDLFLADHPEFVVDRDQEKFLMTFSPSGYLRRLAGASVGPDLSQA